MSQAKTDAKESGSRVGLTRQEAAERLGVSVRTFKRHEKENPFDEGASWTEGKGPTARRMYDPEAIDAILLEEGAEEQQSALSALMRETARASVEIHKSAAIAIKAGVEAVQGTDARTKILVRQLKRASRHNANLERTQVAMWSTMHELRELYATRIIEDAKEQAAKVLSDKRTAFMVETFGMAWPGLVHRFVPSMATTQNILAQVLRRAPPAWREELQAVVLKAPLPPELMSSVFALFEQASEEAARQAAKAEEADKQKAPEQSKGA